MSMTLRQLLATLNEYDDDLMDIEVLIEDEFGVIASIDDVVDANGLFIHPSKNFEEDIDSSANLIIDIKVSIDASQEEPT